MTPALRVLFWELTARCNLTCRHCRADAQSTATTDELGTAELLATAQAIRNAGDPILILTGGEPLVRSDFDEVAAACCRLFSRVALATNGTMVDAARARRIAATGISRASISLDGASAATHDAFRGQRGAFAAARRGLAALRAAGLPIQVNTTAARHNLTELDATLDVALADGATAFHLFVLVPVGCGVKLGDNMRLTPTEIETTLRWLQRRATELDGRIHIKATCAPQYYRLLAEAGAGPRRHGHGGHGLDAVTRGCLAGSAVCFVSRSGAVQPCGYLPLVAGNVRRQPFGEIWSGSPLLATLREPTLLKGACGTCAYSVACGGCRARAHAAHGDYLGADPDCFYV